MDLKQLFHAPEEMSDKDLSSVRNRIRFQRNLPIFSAVFFGAGTHFYFAQLKHTAPRPLVLGMAGVGAVYGAWAAN